MEFALEYESISKAYKPWFGGRAVVALHDFSLAVNPGEIFGFLGPNGAGKSTAIHIALGFLRSSVGFGTMLGQPFGHVSTRKRVGFLSENVAIYSRSAREAIRFYGGLNGLKGNRLSRATSDMLALVNLQDESRRKVGQFSRGMLQRVGIAQALVNDPDILILDEPTSALDPAARVAVREVLVAARNRGKTVFLSSHLLSEVELICDRVAMLNHGMVVRIGRLGDLLESTDQVEVIARGIDLTLFPNSSQVDGAVRLSLPREEQRTAIERIWQQGGEVVSVNPVRRSLEDLFLELMTKEDGKPR